MNPSCVRLSFLYLLLSCLLYNLTESETSSSYTWRLELSGGEGKIVADMGNAAAAAAAASGPGEDNQVQFLFIFCSCALCS
jgi:hypothetical protein